MRGSQPTRPDTDSADRTAAMAIRSLVPVLRELNDGLKAPTALVRAQAGERANALFGTAERLIVYGSLAPGRANHHYLASAGGDWTQGWITGALVFTGWGAALGYPAVRWREDGERIDAWLLCSTTLPSLWPELDVFEGAAYQRVLAPFETEAGVVAVGYLYAAAGG